MVRGAPLKNETATGNKTDCLVHAPLSPAIPHSPTERCLQGEQGKVNGDLTLCHPAQKASSFLSSWQPHQFLKPGPGKTSGWGWGTMASGTWWCCGGVPGTESAACTPTPLGQLGSCTSVPPLPVCPPSPRDLPSLQKTITNHT